MKKFLLTLIVLAFSVLFTAGCGSKTTTTKNGGNGSNGTTTKKEEQVTLRIAGTTMYCGNEENESLYPMVLAIKKFEAEHPGVKVEILRAPQVPNADETDTVEQDWVEFLQSLAAANEFPDVFMAPNMPNVLLQGWCYDLNEFTQNDPVFQTVYEDLRKSGEFFGHQFAVPYSYEFFGYIINKTLFEENNMDYPEFDVTIDEMIDIAKRITKLESNGNSIMGISGGGNMYNYMAAQFDNDLGWFAWNAETQTYDLSSEAFQKAVEYSLKFYSEKSYSNDALTDEEREEYFGDKNWYNVWWSGREAIHFDYSSFLTSLINRKNSGTFNYDFDFIGIPRGGDDKETRTPVKATYMMVGKTTKHAELAYELLKALSFDPDYYCYKLQCSREVENVFPWTFPPLTNDEKVSKAYFEDTFPGFPELRKVIENGNYYFDLWAVQPGFEHARWHIEYNEDLLMSSILTSTCETGEKPLGDHVNEIMRIMNGYIQETNARLKEMYNID